MAQGAEQQILKVLISSRSPEITFSDSSVPLFRPMLFFGSFIGLSGLRLVTGKSYPKLEMTFNFSIFPWHFLVKHFFVHIPCKDQYFLAAILASGRPGFRLVYMS